MFDHRTPQIAQTGRKASSQPPEQNKRTFSERIPMTARIWPSRLLRALVLITGVLLFSSQLALVQFTQEGSKLVGTGALGAASHGGSVALSGDGNTAIVGGP